MQYKLYMKESIRRSGYYIMFVLALLLVPACRYPVNTNYELLVINTSPAHGIVTAKIENDEFRIPEVFYKAYFRPVPVSLNSESTHSDERFSFWWYRHSDPGFPDIIQESSIDFHISTTFWEIEAVFNWLTDKEPIALWDDAVLYIRTHAGRVHLRLHTADSDIDLIELEPYEEDIIKAYIPARHVIFRSRRGTHLLDENLELVLLSESILDHFPLCNSSSIVNMRHSLHSHSTDSNDPYRDLLFIDPAGNRQVIKRFPASSRIRVGDPGMGERVFVTERANDQAFSGLYSVDMALQFANPDLRMTEVSLPIALNVLNPISASTDSSYFLFSRKYERYHNTYYQFLVTDGSRSILIPDGENPHSFELFRRHSYGTIQWINDYQFAVPKGDESWSLVSIIDNNNDLSFTLEISTYDHHSWPIPNRPPVRNNVHPDGTYELEPYGINQPVFIYKVYPDGSRTQLTGKEEQ